MLLECVLAIVLFVGAGLSVLAMTDAASETARAMREAQQAADLAASAMAEIEAGALTPETAGGDPAKWIDPTGRWTGGLDRWSGWELRVDTQPTEREGLVCVTVSVYRGDSESKPAIFVLHQVVRLGTPPADEIGDDDPLAADMGMEAGR